MKLINLLLSFTLLASSMAMASGPATQRFLFPYAGASGDGYLATEDWNTFNNKASSSAPSFSGNLLDLNGHWISTQTTAPVATVGSAAGSGASCTLSHATDVAGSLSVSTGSSGTGTGSLCSVAFNSAYGVAPICVVSTAGSTSLSSSYVTSSTSAVVVNAGTTAPTGATLAYNYHCLQTQ